MHRTALAFAAVFLIVSIAAATSAEPPPWNWSSYVGTSHWRVTVTEDDRDCGPGEGINTEQVDISIRHTGKTAIFGDVGHGEADGTFISNNILHFIARTDEEGTSKLSAYDIFFTTDCLSFAGKYKWDYSDQYGGSCSGTTALSGTNTDGKCPEVPTIPEVQPATTESVDRMVASARVDMSRALELRDIMEAQQAFVFQHMNDPAYAAEVARANTQIANAREELKALDPKVENAYAAIFAKDPNNFNANWDMAQFKKSKGQIQEFVNYVNNALGDEQTAVGKRNDLRQHVAGQMGAADVPTPESSPFIRQEGVDGDAVQSVYGYDIAKQKRNKQTEGVNLFLFFTSGRLAEKAVTSQ
jgi:hypothetical protein